MSECFPQHRWEARAVVRHQKVPGCSEDPQPDGVSSGAAQAVAGQRRPHHTAAELLHQAEGQRQAGGVHQGDWGGGGVQSKGTSTGQCSLQFVESILLSK